MSAVDLQVGRTFRAKKPRNSNGLVNDRTIVYIDRVFARVQYDGPAVAFGRHLPMSSIEEFLDWAERDVTDELPEGEYQDWPAQDGGAK